MDKYGRFYAFTKIAVKLLVSFFVLGFIKSIMQDYLIDYYDYLKIVYGLITFARTIAVLAILTILSYFIYQGYRYMTSQFYIKTKIPVHEAFYHGYFDLAYAYERLRHYGDEVTYNTKTKSIIVTKPNERNYIVVRDIYGKLQGEAKDDSWYIVSKKKKEYGNIRYMKRVPIRNPLYENRDFINQMKKEDGIVYKNYVCLTGLRQNVYNNDQINTVYELEAMLK